MASKNNSWQKYAGMAFQILAALGVAFFIGYHIDKFIGWRYPVFLLLMPLIALAGVFYQVLRDTSNNE